MHLTRNPLTIVHVFLPLIGYTFGKYIPLSHLSVCSKPISLCSPSFSSNSNQILKSQTSKQSIFSNSEGQRPGSAMLTSNSAILAYRLLLSIQKNGKNTLGCKRGWKIGISVEEGLVCCDMFPVLS